jgi:predicted O-methyltransferase YrrM
MSDYLHKIDTFLKKDLFKINNPQIVEFGVREGRSTKLFLDLCDQNNGKLFSVDIDDYSNLFTNKNWKFIKSRDDNFDFLENILPKEIDIIYLDSLHEADHVEKIFYHYFKKLKINGYFFIDDISWVPYLKTEERNNFYCEINNKETFEKILSIYSSNQNNFDLEFSFISSGMCKIIKKNDHLNLQKKLIFRSDSIKNYLRKIIKLFK